jgi:hypothetical protein
MIDGWWLRELQELEYIQALRNDIEKELIEEASIEDRKENVRISIEESIISEAHDLDAELERPTIDQLRQARLMYFKNIEVREQNESNKVFDGKNEPVAELQNNIISPDLPSKKQKCSHIKKNGEQCKLKAKENGLCHIHLKK